MQASRETLEQQLIGSDSGLSGRLFDLIKGVLMPTRDAHLRLIEDNGLTLGQAKALIHLTRSESPMSGGAVAESIGVSAPMASRSLDSLVRKGFAERGECSEDRRVRLFSVTPSGARIAGELVALRRAQVEAFVAALPPDLAERFDALLVDLAERGVIGTCEERA